MTNKHEFDWTVWFWAIVITISIIVGVFNFDAEHIVLCCLTLLPVILLDIVAIRECVLEVIYMINKK